MTASKKLIQAAAGSAGGAPFYDYTIDNSCRFDGSAALKRTPSSSGSLTTWTFSTWIKFDNPNAAFDTIFSAGSTGTNITGIFFGGGDLTAVYDYTPEYYIRPSAKFRDASAWYHFVIVHDTTNSTASDRYRFYLNGERVTNFSVSNYPPQNQSGRINNSSYPHLIGGWAQYPTTDSTYRLGGYLAETHFCDGTAYDSSYFGEFKNGVWIPKSPSVSYGTNGFYMDYADSSNLGNDVSGNNNDYTSIGLTSSDQMIDTPTNNHVTWLPNYQFGGTYYKSSGTLSNGNLTASVNTSSQIGIASSVLPSTGKWYWEIEVDTVAAMGIGMTNTRYLNNIVNNQTLHYSSGGSGNSVYIEGSVVTAYGTSWTTGDVIGVYFNADDGQISWYKNGTAMDSSPYSLSYSDGWIPYIAQLSGAGTCVGTLVTDENKFNHTPPTDALALSTANLPEPAIGPNSTTTSDEHFNTVLYTGTGAAQSITGLGFQPDFLWFKSRSGAYNHALYDAIRGRAWGLLSNATNAEQSAASNADLVSFDSDGFSLGIVEDFTSVNGSGQSIVSWAWKGNGSGVTNTDGSITSTVSANTDAGFSIATFTMPSSGNFTVGHGLGVAPKMYIMKRTSNTSSWGVWHTGLSSGTYYILLDTTGAQVNDSTVWTSAPTSTVLNIGSAWPSGGQTAVIYSFAEVEGFSKFGKYTGNGSADGPFIYTGFRPAWILIKALSGIENWVIYDTARDTYNELDSVLYTNLSNSEFSGTTVNTDALSNGFKPRDTWTAINGSGTTYIYMAFAENPFKYSNAR